MADIRWNRDFDRLRTHVQGLPNEMREVAKTIVAETVKNGAETMYDLIDRVDTEHMKGSVSYEGPKSQRWRVSGKFGWGLHGAKVEPYFIYQEQGFTNSRSGKDVPPMHALLRAFMVTREKFFARVKEAAR